MRSLILCEDEPAVAEALAAMVEENVPGGYQIALYPSWEALRTAVDKGLRPDIALLDIRLPDGDGIALARECFPEGSPTQVIFVSGYPEYCSEVYETEHIYFLLKPVGSEALARALDKAEQRLARQEPIWLVVHNGNDVEKIPQREIRTLESRGRKVAIRCVDRNVECYGTLLELERQLSGSFVRCHKSYYANLRHATRMEAGRLVMDDGGEIPISRNRRSDIRKRFLAYLQETYG